MHFSSVADSFVSSRNPLYVLLDERRAAGSPIIDLVRGNATEHGITFPLDLLNDILREAATAAQIYRPDSFGQPAARRAISEYYGSTFPESQILVTPGTSVSYWYCFKLLAEPGDEILTPQPSYPLFDYIARLCGVNLTSYRLDEDRAWSIDFADLERQITSRTRAIVLISPHNPTGMVAGHNDLLQLADIAKRFELPIISDEVFSEFCYSGSPLPRPASTSAPLVLTLNGISKMFSLPGMKIGWIGVSGQDSLVSRAMSALELISDTFLPVNEVAQFALPSIFSEGPAFLKHYKEWIGLCRDEALKSLDKCQFSKPAGGFYITLKLRQDEDSAAEQLLRQSGILVHPGYFYDIPPDHLVMTFIQDTALIKDAFLKIAEVAQTPDSA